MNLKPIQNPEPMITVRGYELVRLILSPEFELVCDLGTIPFPTNISSPHIQSGHLPTSDCRIYRYKGEPAVVIETFPGTFQTFKVSDCES